MNDNIVRQGALDDFGSTQARIDALRAEIAAQEEHLAQVANFIDRYEGYLANAAAPRTLVPAYAN